MTNPSSNAGPQQTLRELLARTSVMVLSTVGPEGPWSTPVGFDVTDDLEFRFLSMPDTRHVRHLEARPDVSLAAFSTDGDGGDGNIGIQVTGTARHIAGSGQGQWWTFVVVPHQAWVFDSRVPGLHRRPVDLAGYRVR